MEQPISEFFHDFRQELMAGAEAHGAFQLSEFMEAFAAELMETGFIEGFELCHYRAQRGMRVDGYWFNDEGELDLFVADFDSREALQSLTQTDVIAVFKRVENFFEASLTKRLFDDLDETTPEFGLSREISDRKSLLRRVNFFVVSERALSDRMQNIEAGKICDIEATYQIWDMSRLQRQRSSRGHKEPLDIDFKAEFGSGLSSLSAHLGSGAHKSYLVVMPGDMLATLYAKHGARLLEQNVRSFLQARGKVNKGIRTTILNEPGMFFAYNNGITATAQEVEVELGDKAPEIVRIKDLQIVNGGQTTASLFHTKRRDKATLDRVFVQMKLSVISPEDSEIVVPRISEYANTQNRVNAADFFSNHPFHVRMEGFSRRIWAPAQSGAQRETKWFYERARGQYADAQAKLTPSEQKRFKAEYPKPQMFTKTDLAKFENVWDDHPKWVNLGAQKNFSSYAGRIGKAWSKNPDSFNELYYRRAIARAIIFRWTEKMVSGEPWYNGGYRANTVAYAIATVNELCKRAGKSVDFQKCWQSQAVYPELAEGLRKAAKFVNDDITQPPQGISNISEWCKKDSCWDRIQGKLDELEFEIDQAFFTSLISSDAQKNEQKQAKKVQRIDDGIDAQRKVLKVPGQAWSKIRQVGVEREILTEKEVGIIRVAEQIPHKIPSEKQSEILIAVLDKAREEGIF
ncbi:AIPR family protein [Spiribacter sp. C176]|uniref:AIPR family protein n=1 Tax=Spiribacter salilacus TaxID=2664894 RepID=A0A6N7QMA0_9GAMM|nr:AIPR family protein [Spiribacter salilacus]MRH77606.1 AIPR family protein [Spiribacter salilacus]